MILKNYEPKNVFGIFEEITKIPHGSFNMEKISQWVVDFAVENGLRHIKDNDGNVIVIKEADSGFEDIPPVILQGHLDMVCAKTSDSDFDFTKDALRIYVDGDILKARDTSIGGDDGIAVAMALALMTDKSLKTGKIESIFTVNEEVGLLGADSIDTSSITGKYMINIDSCTEGELTVGCAGGIRIEVSFPVKSISATGETYTLKANGFLGGHSGEMIHLGHANAVLLTFDLINILQKEFDVDIISINGGTADNAIPTFAEAQLLIPSGSFNNINNFVNIFTKEEKNKYKGIDESINFTLEKSTITNKKAFSRQFYNNISSFLKSVPDGVVAMNPDIPDSVLTSSNLGIIKSCDDSIKLTFLMRSSDNKQNSSLYEKFVSSAKQFDASVKLVNSYPGWKDNPKSKLTALMKEIYIELYNEEPKIISIHAGLECGLFVNKIPGLDCVSIGPNMYNLHTINEKISISSVERTYEYVKEIIRRID